MSRICTYTLLRNTSACARAIRVNFFIVSYLESRSGSEWVHIIRALRRFTDKTVIAIAIAGASSHGHSTNRRPSAASLSITPQLGVIEGNPSPTYDNVASE